MIGPVLLLSNIFHLLLQTLIMGNRDNIDEMSSTSASMLMSIIKLIDKYDLYGQVAYPKHHKQNEVPDIYRLAAKTKVHLNKDIRSIAFDVYVLITDNLILSVSVSLYCIEIIVKNTILYCYFILISVMRRKISVLLILALIFE